MDNHAEIRAVVETTLYYAGLEQREMRREYMKLYRSSEENRKKLKAAQRRYYMKHRTKIIAKNSERARRRESGV